MTRQIAIVIALIAAAVILVAAMAWSTAARGQAPPGPAQAHFGHR